MSGREKAAADQLAPVSAGHARRLAAAFLVVGLVLLGPAGCSWIPRPSSPAGVGRAPSGLAAWQIPPGELGTQRLFRVRYDGPEGEVGLRVTLWLATAERYRVSAVDALGRAVWTLSISDGRGLWLDHRQESYCRFAGAIDLGSVPLSPFRFAALPALLLGRLPEPPVTPPDPGRDEYHDADGKRWTFQESQGRVVSWTVWRAGEPAAWWNGRGEEAILSERRDNVQVRWREVVREKLAGAPPEPELPATYAPACADGRTPRGERAAQGAG